MKKNTIILSIRWIALMLTYLLGDIPRIFSGDIVLGKMHEFNFTQRCSGSPVDISI